MLNGNGYQQNKSLFLEVLPWQILRGEFLGEPEILIQKLNKKLNHIKKGKIILTKEQILFIYFQLAITITNHILGKSSYVFKNKL
jgi:hypothetical protein